METFRYLKKEGDNYILKSQVGIARTALILEVGLGTFCFVRYLMVKANPTLIFIGVILFALAFLTFLGLNHKIIFNPLNRTVTFPNPRQRNKEGATYSFDEFTNFKMIKIKQQPIGITTNNWLQMEFQKEGKIKAMQIRQYGPSSKKSQYLIDEIETIMGLNQVNA